MNLLLVVKWVITIWMLVIAPATCDIVFDLKQPENYGKFVEQVRNEIKDPKNQFFGIPVIKAPDPKNKYLYIEIKSTAISITLQIQIENLYVVAYRDKYKENDRYFYFTSLNLDEKEVFPNVKNKKDKPIEMKCNHNYGSIEKVSNKNIKDLKFQLSKLEEAMTNAYGKEIKKNDKDFPKRQASFLLYSILMTSEAIRFKYIEQKTVNKQNSDGKVAGLVRVWDKLSVQIIRADEKTREFESAIQVKIDENPLEFWEVKNVDDIKSYMGILKKGKKSSRSKITSSKIVLDNNKSFYG